MMAGRIGPLAMTVAVALTQASVARAEVRAVERESFSIHHEQDVAASPDAVFAALSQPGAWWNPEHSWSGDTQRFSLEPRAGGCWCESLPNGGSVEHGRIISYDPGRRLIVMQSLLGPLQTMAIAGRLSWRVEPVEGEPARSRIAWTYQVAHVPTGNPAQDAALAAGVDAVMREQMGRLAMHASGTAPQR